MHATNDNDALLEYPTADHVAAVDFETFYSKKDGVSIATQGTYNYLHDPQFEAYLVSIATNTGLIWVGHPKHAPWDKISGPEWTWVSHNRSFDQPVYELLQEQGIVSDAVKPRVWECTADLTAYLGYPRSLANAAKYLLKVEVDKSPRDKMNGVKWSNVSEEQRGELIGYATDDAILCLRLWEEHSEKWPEWERQFSRLTYKQVARGIRVDVPTLEQGIKNLKKLVFAADALIPWASEGAALSYKKFCEECNKVGVTPPPSLDMKDEVCAAWEEEYGERIPWVHAMRTKRRANTFLKKMEKLHSLVRPDGRASLPIKYCGASTRRASGGYSEKSDSGFNPQNLPRESILGPEFVKYGVLSGKGLSAKEIDNLGINLRHLLIASEGKVLTAVDLSNIEPRLVFYTVDDQKMLDTIRSGVEIYEAHARTTMDYNLDISLKEAAKKDPKYDTMRRTSKARVIGLGFGCGPDKFVVVAWTMAGLRIDLDTSKEIVADYREKNDRIPNAWRVLNQALINASMMKEILTVELPSGNVLEYRDVQIGFEDSKRFKGQREKFYSALICKGEKMIRTKLYGAKLFENYIQAAARDLFAQALLRIEEAGHQIVMQTHDEGVFENDPSVPPQEFERLMSIPPEWAQDLPLGAEAYSGKFYSK